MYLLDDSGSKLHFDLNSEEKRDLFANQKASISSFDGLPNKLLEAKDNARRVNTSLPGVLVTGKGRT